MKLKIFLSVLLALSTAERLNQSIYRSFSNIKACFRRLNGTDEFGCTSDFSGNVGVLQYIDSQDVSSIQNKDHAPYVVLLSPEVFSGSMLEKLKDSGNVNGVILPGIREGKWKNKIPSEQSDDVPCPNQGSSIYTDSEDQCGSTTTPWNPAGENILWRNWDFPIFLINDGNTTQDLFDCYDEFNSGAEVNWPLCSVELKSPMYAAKDSETCFRRSNIVVTLTPQDYCEPLSDYNLYYFQSPRNRTKSDGTKIAQKDKSVVVIMARLDALNIFDKEENGFDSPSTGIVTLIATAEAIKKSLVNSYKPGHENILFLLVHGESLDYLGSNRLVYDMMKDDFPAKLAKDIEEDASTTSRILSNGTQPIFNLDHIKYIIELGQLANTKSSTLYYHAHNLIPDLENIIASLRRSSVDVKASSRSVLPPSSAQSFLKEKSDIPVVVLTNFDEQFANLYYHSIYDTALVHNYNYSKGEAQPIVSHLTGVATALASALADHVITTGAPPQADRKSVNSMLECYTQTKNCSLYRLVGTPNGFPYIGNLDEGPHPQYISVHSSYHTEMTKQILQYFTGDLDQDKNCTDPNEKILQKDHCQEVCLQKNREQQIYTYQFMVGSEDCFNSTGAICGNCYKTSVGKKMARSPAFEDDIWQTYDWASGQYPTWTESYWKSISGRMFLQPSPSSQYSTLAIGIIVSLLSFPITYWLQKKSSIIFENAGTDISSAIGANPAPVAL